MSLGGLLTLLLGVIFKMNPDTADQFGSYLDWGLLASGLVSAGGVWTFVKNSAVQHGVAVTALKMQHSAAQTAVAVAQAQPPKDVDGQYSASITAAECMKQAALDGDFDFVAAMVEACKKSKNYVKMVGLLACLVLTGCAHQADGGPPSPFGSKKKSPAQVPTGEEQAAVYQAPPEVSPVVDKLDTIIDKFSELNQKTVAATSAAPRRNRSNTSAADLPQLQVKDYNVTIGSFFIVEAVTNCPNVKFMLLTTPGVAVIPNFLENGKPLFNPDVTNAVLMQATVAGEYSAMAYTSLNDVLSDPVLFTITVSGVGPQPPPPPQPQPGPVPAPPATVTTAKSIMVVTIDNVLARPQAVSTVLDDMTLFDPSTPGRSGSLHAQGHQFFKANSTNVAVQTDYKRMLDAAGGQPCVVLLDAVTGAWLNQGPNECKLPTTTSQLQALVTKYTSKGIR